MKLKKGDEVIVISGVDKGKTAKIVGILVKENKVVLEGEGLHLAKHHLKPSQANPEGGIVEKARPIDASNVMLVTEVNKKKVATRVSYKVVEEKAAKGNAPKTRKIRVAKKNNKELD